MSERFTTEWVERVSKIFALEKEIRELEKKLEKERSKDADNYCHY